MFIQQGDVLFFELGALPDGATKCVDLIVAHGEQTGHVHRFTDTANAQLFMHDGTMYAVVGEPATVVHEEHGAVKLSPGVWRVGLVKEYDPFEETIRNVAD